METSKTIAGLVGPTLLAIGAGLVLNLGSISGVLEPLSRDPALVLIYGIFLFVAGLAIVRFPNHWAAEWAVLAMIVGWLLGLGGLARILFPIRLAAAAACCSELGHDGYNSRDPCSGRRLPIVESLCARLR
jgi:hypothetical protein